MSFSQTKNMIDPKQIQMIEMFRSWKSFLDVKKFLY